MQNPFSHPTFNMAALTASINLLPNTYGRTESLALFPSKSVRFRCLIPENYGVLYEESETRRKSLWDKYYMQMPERRRQSVERSVIVKKA